MSYEPKQKNKVPEAWSLAFAICGLVALGFGLYSKIKGGGVLQTLALFFFCAMLYVMVRYKFTRVRYTLRKKAPKGYGSEDEEDEDGDTVLVSDSGEPLPLTAYPPSRLEIIIEKAQGKRAFIGESLISLSDIICVDPFTTKEDKKAQYAKFPKTPTYKYIRNMVGYEACAVVVNTAQGKARIVIEPSDKLRDYLSAVARYNRDKSEED